MVFSSALERNLIADTKVIILGIGSNLGKKAANLNRAVRMLAGLGMVYECSRIYASESLSRDGAPEYFNAVVALGTTHNPWHVMHKIKYIERAMGRPQRYPRWSSRIIDIDIITWGRSIIKSPKLTIPHPHYLKREFVTRPMCDILHKPKFGTGSIRLTTHRIACYAGSTR